MLGDYSFLTDHSYSLRLEADASNGLPLNQREDKNKKRPRSSKQTKKTASTSNRTVSIDRSSSDKENSSLVLSSSVDVPAPVASVSVNTTKKKATGSGRSRASARTAMTNSRASSGKKQENKASSKAGVKTTQGSITKKKKVVHRGQTKLSTNSQIDSTDVPLSLSIEERVKLRRTKPLQVSATSSELKPVKKKQSQSRRSKERAVQEDIKQIRESMTKEKKAQPRKISPVVATIKTNKFFLGSGLDLDNIVLGNRQRRGVQS